jgi:apolipoprotein N-acyltransferase
MSPPSALVSPQAQFKKAPRSKVPTRAHRHEPFILLFALAAGAALGLSAPGFDQWYLAWFGLVPLLWLTGTARNAVQAAFRGLAFGTGYNVVYMCWYLSLRTVFLVGTFRCVSDLMPAAAWLLMSVHQGLFIAIFAAVARSLPLRPGWLAVKDAGKVMLPSFVVLPCLWVLIVDKLGNAPALLGVPWSQLQYTQYNQVHLVQIASVVGGTGICCLLVMFNATVYSLLASSFRSRGSLIATGLTMVSIVCGALGYGAWHLQIEPQTTASEKMVHVSALQANLAHKVHDTNSLEIAGKYISLTNQCAPGICVWPEWSLVCDFRKSTNILQQFAKLPSERRQSWICGVFDSDAEGRTYNAVCAFDRSGTMSSQTYRKRRLVPFGEYTPDFVRLTPLGMLLYGANSGFEETSPGVAGSVFHVHETAVAPLLCFEKLYPDLVADSVRHGGEIIVDCSNNSWFRPSILSDQMVSFSVMRAVENHRPFVFATALGPSTIVDACGRLVAQAPRAQAAVIAADVAVHNDQTIFNRFCFW